MVLTVTLNPLLEHRLTYRKIHQGMVNRNPIEEFKTGGKGINVSRQLQHLNIPNLAYIFLGGNIGRIYKHILENELIKFTVQKINSETRSAVLIKDESEKIITSYFGTDPEISSREVEEFNNKLEKMIRNCEIVVFSGSSPCRETDSIIPFGIKTANKYDKVSVCDTYGSFLEECFECSPTVIHNNIEEIETSLKISLKDETEKIKFLEYLYGKGIKQAFITDSAKEIYASNFDFYFKLENPKIAAADPTGSGDSFTAGIVHGWYNDLTFEESLKTAAALGILNAQRFDTCNVEPDEVQQVKEKLIISPIGKKIRSIDVSPD